MASERTEELYRVLLSKGYPKELCAEIAYKNMNTDYTATRMLGYLYRYTNPKIEDLVDEMLAILSDRAQIIEKKEAWMTIICAQILTEWSKLHCRFRCRRPSVRDGM